MAEDQPEALTYSYRPSLLGAPWEFKLTPAGLVWSAGRRSGTTRYRDIEAIRLSFLPAALQSRIFKTEIWSSSGPRLTVTSSTWKSMVERAAQNGPYREFVTQLHARLAEAGATPQFICGVPAYIYWPGVVVFVLVSLGLAALTVRALQSGPLAGAAFVGGFLALFVWQLGGYFRRNRPGRYRTGELPSGLLPRV